MSIIFRRNAKLTVLIVLGSILFFIHCKEKSSTYVPSDHAPDRPTELRANLVGSSRTHLYWTDNSENEDYFQIQRKDGSDDWKDLIQIPSDSTYYQDSLGRVAPESRFSYRVSAVNTHGRSYWSNTYGVVTPEADPQCLVIIEDDFSEAKKISALAEGPTIWMCSDRYGYYRIMDMHECSRTTLSDSGYAEEFSLNGKEAGDITMQYNRRIKDNILHLELTFMSNPSLEMTQSTNHRLGFGFHNPSKSSWKDKYLNNGLQDIETFTTEIPLVDRYVVEPGKLYYVKVEIDLDSESYSLWVNNQKLCKDLSLYTILMVPSLSLGLIQS